MKKMHFKIKPGTTISDVYAAGAEKGGTWISKDSVCLMYRSFSKRNFEILVYVAFPEDLSKWNEHDYIMVVDEDFMVPYSRYMNMQKDYDEPNTNSALAWCIQEVNEFIQRMPFVMEREENQ